MRFSPVNTMLLEELNLTVPIKAIERNMVYGIWQRGLGGLNKLQ